MSDLPYGCVFQYERQIADASWALIFTWAQRDYSGEPYAYSAAVLGRGDLDGFWRVGVLNAHGQAPYIHKMENRKDAEDAFERVVRLILDRSTNLHVPHSMGLCKNGWRP